MDYSLTSEIEIIKPLTLETARLASEQFIKEILPYPGSFKGRGIVIAAGGLKYFSNAWVCIKILRHLGCQLPIEVWHFGDKELDQEMRALLQPLGVNCVDAMQFHKRYPMRLLGGWQLKSYAVLHSAFKEILFLDADNVPVSDPEYLFESGEFKETGAIFWPDREVFHPNHRIWSICGVSFREEPQFESGQFMVEKEKCWQALCLAQWYNNHSDFYYRHIYGDKDTFHMAFRKLNKTYAMPKTRIHLLQHTMCQHDFQGKRTFQHRNFDKWSFFGLNKHINGFMLEDECFAFLAELKNIMQPRWKRFLFIPGERAFRVRTAATKIANHLFRYKRIGRDSRLMTFLGNGIIGLGHAPREMFWNLVEENQNLILEISSTDGVTCRLKSNGRGGWTGRWIRYPKMSVELSPVIRRLSDQPAHFRELVDTIVKTEFDYYRIGHESRLMTFLPNGLVGQGVANCELFWDLEERDGKVIFQIFSEKRITCALEKYSGGIWRGTWLVHERSDIELIPRHTHVPIPNKTGGNICVANVKPPGDAVITLGERNARHASEHFISQIPAYLGRFRGRGVVIAAGGLKYFANAWVCIKMLRRLGCQIPIQVWYLGEKSLNESMRALLRSMDVNCVDAFKVREKHPVRLLVAGGLKSFALLNSPFEEVLLLDADNVPILDPEGLFHSEPFRKTGAVFWPGFSYYRPEARTLDICGLTGQNDLQFDCGQILINKEKCWPALCLNMWYNEHWDFYQQYVRHAKNTFYMAFRKLNQAYCMPEAPLQMLQHATCQHDFEGRRIFQHRNGDKWNLFGFNEAIADFLYEEICLQYLHELRLLMREHFVAQFNLASKAPQEQEMVLEITGLEFNFRRFCYDCRLMTFLNFGVIGTGNGDNEMFWDLRERNGEILLEISSDTEITCELKRGPDGGWRGRSRCRKKIPIELVPTSECISV